MAGLDHLNKWSVSPKVGIPEMRHTIPNDEITGRLSKCSGRPLGLCGRRLPELNLIPIRVVDPGEATVGFIHSFGVNLYALLF